MSRMLPEVNAYLMDIFNARSDTSPAQSFVFFFALATPIALAMLAYVIRGILNLTIWYDAKKRPAYIDPFFYVAIVLVLIWIFNGFFTIICEVRDFLSHHPKASSWYGNQPFDADFVRYSVMSLFIFVAGAISLFLMERREKFLGAVPFYTIFIFLFVTPIFYNVQFEREGLLPKEAGGFILGLQLICFFGLHWALNRKFIPIKSMILLPLGLFMAWCMIGFFIFPHQLAAIKNLKQLMTFAAIFFSIVYFVKSEKHLRILVWVAIIAANISVAWGLMRFFGFNLFGLPDSFFQEPKAGKSFLLAGFFANPNYLAEYLAVIILMCIGMGFFTKNQVAKVILFIIAGVDIFHLMMTYTRAAWVGVGLGAIAAELLFLIYTIRMKPFASRDTETYNTRKMLTNFLAVVAAIRAATLLLGFYLMFSRGLFNALVTGAQFIGLVILALEIWLLIQGLRGLKAENATGKPGMNTGLITSPAAAVGITLVALLMIFGTFYNVTKNLAEKTQSYPHTISPAERAASLADVKGDETFRNRLNMWKVGWEMIKDRPIFGGGLGAYEIEYLEYQDKIVSRYSFDDFSQWFHNTIPTFRAHNDHIQTITELGLLGFGLWVWFWVAVFLTAWRGFVYAPNFGERFLILAIFASLISINISAMFSFPFHKIQTGGLIFMLIGMLAFLRHRQMQSGAVPSEAAKPVPSPKQGKGKASSTVKKTRVRKNTGPDIGQYEYCTSPSANSMPVRILKWIAFVVILLGVTIGMYSQIQHFRSNTFFSWGSRFISQKYNDYNASRDYWFKRATETNPSNGRAEFFWGWATSKTQEYSKGVERLLHAQRLYPQTDTHYTLGLTYTWWGNELNSEGNDVGAREKFDLAIDALKTASQRLPTRLEYYTELVKLLNRTARFDEAAKYSERAIIVYEWVSMAQNVEYMFYLWRGQALIAQDKLEEAIEVLHGATELVYKKQAISQRAKGVRPVPLVDQPQAYLLLGQAYEKKGDLVNAEEQYNIYLTKKNKLPKESQSNDIFFFQGRLYEKMADELPDEESIIEYKQRARDKYSIIVDIYTKYERAKEKEGAEQLSQKAMKEFTSLNGRPVSEKVYNESLSGIERIKVGEPYPTKEEIMVIESESVDIGEAAIDVSEDQ